jgi:hypothetical protein
MVHHSTVPKKKQIQNRYNNTQDIHAYTLKHKPNTPKRQFLRKSASAMNLWICLPKTLCTKWCITAQSAQKMNIQNVRKGSTEMGQQ